MIHGIRVMLLQFLCCLKSRADLQGENLMLRLQIGVLRRSSSNRVRTTGIDRLSFVWLYRMWPSSIDAVQFFHLKTLVRWHRQGFKSYWRWKSRSHVGRPKVGVELRSLILKISRQNPPWCAPRIHRELFKLGFNVSQATVSRYLPRRPRDPGQRWKTFLSNHRHCVASIDFFVVPTVSFKLLFVLVVLSHQRRRLVHLSVTPNPTAAWTVQQMREAFPWEDGPGYVIHDRERAFGKALRKRLQALGIPSARTAPRSPWQNGHVERVIGSIRRECLDHTIIFNERHLRRILRGYIAYYSESRTHLALSKYSTLPRAISPPSDGAIVAISQAGGLHHRYERRAA